MLSFPSGNIIFIPVNKRICGNYILSDKTPIQMTNGKTMDKKETTWIQKSLIQNKILVSDIELCGIVSFW